MSRGDLGWADIWPLFVCGWREAFVPLAVLAWPLGRLAKEI
jgi:hypothetical protein